MTNTSAAIAILSRLILKFWLGPASECKFSHFQFCPALVCTSRVFLSELSQCYFIYFSSKTPNNWSEWCTSDWSAMWNSSILNTLHEINRCKVHFTNKFFNNLNLRWKTVHPAPNWKFNTINRNSNISALRWCSLDWDSPVVLPRGSTTISNITYSLATRFIDTCSIATLIRFVLVFFFSIVFRLFFSQCITTFHISKQLTRKLFGCRLQCMYLFHSC